MNEVKLNRHSPIAGQGLIHDVQCMAAVPGKSGLVVSGDASGEVHLWNVETGMSWVCKYTHVYTTAGKHIRRVIHIYA